MLSIAGVVFALLVTGTDFNVASFMGLIMIIGIVAKNGILLLDADEKYRAEGVAPREAMVHAAQRRLRPIVMTAMAAICGMLPLAFALGSGSQMLQPLAIAVIGGLMVSIALSLIVTPVTYYLMTHAKIEKRASKNDVSLAIRLLGELKALSSIAANRNALAADDQHGKAVGQNRGPWMRVLRGGCGSGAKLSGREIDAAVGRIEGHGASAALCGHVLDDGKARLTGVDHGQRSFAVRGEGQLVLRVEARGVRTLADFGRGEHLAGIGIHHRHLLAVADGEEMTAGGIDGEARGRVAAGEWPLRGDLLRSSIEADNLVLALDVVVDIPLPSATGNSGLPGNGMVATTFCVFVSMTVALLLRPLKAHTVFVTGS